MDNMISNYKGARSGFRLSNNMLIDSSMFELVCLFYKILLFNQKLIILTSFVAIFLHQQFIFKSVHWMIQLTLFIYYESTKNRFLKQVSRRFTLIKNKVAI